MKALAVQKKTVALMENGTWAAMTAKQMREKLSELKQIEFQPLLAHGLK